MEEHMKESCSIIYFCSSAQDEIHELYHKRSPPKAASGASEELNCIYENVGALLDEDRGDFNEAFVCSRSQQCMDRLESHANSIPTILLIELRNSPSELKDKKKGAFSFLRSLSNDIRGARFQKHVLPFVLITTGEDHGTTDLDQEVTTSCLQAGAMEVFRSPLRHDDINRMLGHYKNKNQPPANLIGAPMAQNLVDSIHDVSKPPRTDIYRPDELLSSERKAAVEHAVGRWYFPAQDFNMDELTYAALFMLEHVLRCPTLHAYRLPRRQIVAFLLATRRQYKHEREVHYHNWRHAVDVSQCIFCFLLDLQLCSPLDSAQRNPSELSPLERLLTPLEGLILLVSAIGHDVGHPGVNNAFLVACSHPLAQAYNDRSVLENYHCAAYQQLLRRHWPSLNQSAGFRATMISTVLATDMQRHFEYMANLSDLKGKVEHGKANVSEWSDKERQSTKELIMALLIKAADISNVARPFTIAAQWAKILMYEFARQGELESEIQIPTCLFGGPPNTEDMLAGAQSQKGFISLFGIPLFQGIGGVMPCLAVAVRELERNQGLWEEEIEREKQRREPGGAMERPHFASVSKDEVAEAEFEHRKSEPNAVPIDAFQPPSSPPKRVKIDSSESSTSPSKHGAHDLRQQMTTGVAFNEDKRSSAPFATSLLMPLSPSGTSQSRRSSKDVALESLSASAQQNMKPGSRRSSVDAGWQVHQSYPGSRRGSKDESLTTIFVAGGVTQNRRSSPSASDKKVSPAKSMGRRQSSQKQATPYASEPSTRSPSGNAMMATELQSSPRISPSSHALDGGLTTPPDALASIPSTEDPFITPGEWPERDGSHQPSMDENTAGELPSTPLPPPALDLSKSESSRASTREIEAPGTGIRQSRSRSRLRGLKFWKRRREVSGVEAGNLPASPP